MDSLHIDITAITAILVAGLVMLVPVTGFTLRFAIEPFLATIGRIRAAASRESTARDLEARVARVARLEAKLDAAVAALRRLIEQQQQGDRRNAA